MKYIFYYTSLLTPGFFLLLPYGTKAFSFQSLSDDSDTGSISVSLSPSEPGPNQLVKVAIISYGIDLDRAEISWYLNTKLEKTAIGEKTFSFKTGPLGSLSDILIVAKTQEGNIAQKTIEVRPTGITLVWEASSYTPPFYKGKALYPYQGTLKIVALPEIVTESGSTVNPKNLVYTWRLNDKARPDDSGFGKNSMTFNGTIPIRNSDIDVEAVTMDGKYVARGRISVEPGSPSLLFYEDNPIYGILYNKALQGSVALQNQEIRIAATPYFIGKKTKEDRLLKYDWTLNGESLSATVANENKSSLSFRQERGVAGTAAVGLQISNTAKILQFAANTLSLSFGENRQFNLFQTQ